MHRNGQKNNDRHMDKVQINSYTQYSASSYHNQASISLSNGQCVNMLLHKENSYTMDIQLVYFGTQHSLDRYTQIGHLSYFLHMLKANSIQKKVTAIPAFEATKVERTQSISIKTWSLGKNLQKPLLGKIFRKLGSQDEEYSHFRFTVAPKIYFHRYPVLLQKELVSRGPDLLFHAISSFFPQINSFLHKQHFN